MTLVPSRFVRGLADRLGLSIVGIDALTLKRLRQGKGFSYRHADGTPIRDRAELTRLKSLAVPPAYVEVCYAADPSAHLQAIGTDAAGRRQYRYHPKWTEVREAQKAQRLARIARALPDIKRAVAKGLACEDCTQAFAVAAIVHLVGLTSIRAGGESYARDSGTRGASTLLKSNVKLGRGQVALSFTAKGGKAVSKTIRDARLCAALARMIELPGRRLFQYRAEDGTCRPVRAAEVNQFLRAVAGRRISLKDFRTLTGSSAALAALTNVEPAASERGRRSQLRSVVGDVAEELANTPAVCRTSYVHGAVVAAFEQGKLARLRKPPRSAAGAAEMLAKLVSRQETPTGR